MLAVFCFLAWGWNKRLWSGIKKAWGGPLIFTEIIWWHQTYALWLFASLLENLLPPSPLTYFTLAILLFGTWLLSSKLEVFAEPISGKYVWDLCLWCVILGYLQTWQWPVLTLALAYSQEAKAETWWVGSEMDRAHAVSPPPNFGSASGSVLSTLVWTNLWTEIITSKVRKFAMTWHALISQSRTSEINSEQVSRLCSKEKSHAL